MTQGGKSNFSTADADLGKEGERSLCRKPNQIKEVLENDLLTVILAGSKNWIETKYPWSIGKVYR